MVRCICCQPSAVEGGEIMFMHIASFLLSVAAGIVGHYVCKWLDGE